ncbi:Peptidase family M23 [Pseudonocardia ammonioxydans]|uniref:Peptidase family M23 n=1 Tax=Pseudonocardia ammonioxydans TaxID=260086 RepID=A0A1I5HAW4_PSUAM|nr:Peptidase family M23 [Pseudonocardia ammonioxydans]
MAGAQTAYDQLDPPPIDAKVRPVAVMSLQPVAAAAAPAPAAGSVSEADLPDTARPEDLAALAKGARIGLEMQRRSTLLSDARADGAPAAAVSGDEATAQPVQGRITSTAGPRWGATHYGLDIANKIGTPIFAVADGVVEKSGPASGFGLWVVIRHDDGSRSVYGHINQAFVAADDRVSAGDQIAEVGNRGQSTGPHLHLEIRQGSTSGDKVDPVGWLRERGLELSG